MLDTEIVLKCLLKAADLGFTHAPGVVAEQQFFAEHAPGRLHFPLIDVDVAFVESGPVALPHWRAAMDGQKL